MEVKIVIDVSDNILEKLNNIPPKPGIYKFLDREGRIIYIGKSICLNKRVRTYFANNPKWDKVKRMVPFIVDIEFIVTDTHLEARLLECQLIKSIKPVFNTQMKNDEKYAFLKVEDYNIHNPLSLVYEREGASFGPFRRKYSLYKVIDNLRNFYPIKKDVKGYCFQYKLFPAAMDRADFEENKKTLIEILSDDRNLSLFISCIEEEMKKAASQCRFETAMVFRDIIYSLNYLKSGIIGYRDMFSKDILLKLPTKEGYKLFFISKGQVLLKKRYKNYSKKYIDVFIRNGIEISRDFILPNDEKISLDYRDIIYSEILSLPKEYIKILD